MLFLASQIQLFGISLNASPAIGQGISDVMEGQQIVLRLNLLLSYDCRVEKVTWAGPVHI